MLFVTVSTRSPNMDIVPRSRKFRRYTQQHSGRTRKSSRRLSLLFSPTSLISIPSCSCNTSSWFLRSTSSKCSFWTGVDGLFILTAMSARPCVRVMLGCKRCKDHARTVLQQRHMLIDSSPRVDVLIANTGYTYYSGIAKRYPRLRGKLAVPTHHRYMWG